MPTSDNEVLFLLTSAEGKAQPREPKEYSLSTVGVDDAGGPPRVLVDSAH